MYLCFLDWIGFFGRLGICLEFLVRVLWWYGGLCVFVLLVDWWIVCILGLGKILVWLVWLVYSLNLVLLDFG